MPTAQEVRDAVLASAGENSNLLIVLTATGEAPSVLRGHLGRVSKTQDAVLEQETNVTSLTSLVETKFKSHRKYRDSTARRFLYRATWMLRKFEAKANTEEQQYFAALREKSKAEGRLKTLQSELRVLEKDKVPLEREVKKHGDTHAAIDALYAKLFEGPTPGFPVEDQREGAFKTARQSNEDKLNTVRAARRALEQLSQANINVRRAANHLKMGTYQLQDSIFFFDEAEVSVRRSDEYTRFALDNVSKAGRSLQDAPPAVIAELTSLAGRLNGALMRPVSFSSDQRDEILAMIKAAERVLELSRQQLVDAADLVRADGEEAQKTVRTTARAMEDSRQSLQEERQAIFERVAGFGEAAPSYRECCDRADGFCEVPADQPVIDPGDLAAKEDDVAEGRAEVPPPSASAANGEGSSSARPQPDLTLGDVKQPL